MAPKKETEKDDSREKIAEAIERLIDVLTYISGNPTLLIAGRHHAPLQKAVDEMSRRLRGNSVPAAWRLRLNNVSAVELEKSGLKGDEARFKLGVADQPYERFLDMKAERPPLDIAWLARELAEYQQKQREEREELRRSIPLTPVGRFFARFRPTTVEYLDAADVLVGSLKVIPGMHEFMEGLGEVTKAVSVAVRSYEPAG